MALLKGLNPMGVQETTCVEPRDFPEGASQSWNDGADVTLDTNGLVVAFADNTSLGSTDQVLGRTNRRATGTANANQSITLFRRSTRLTLPVWHTTPASAVTAQNLVGKAYGLRNVAGVGLVVNISDTTNPKVKVMEIKKDYPVGEQYGTVDVEFLADATVFP